MHRSSRHKYTTSHFHHSSPEWTCRLAMYSNSSSFLGGSNSSRPGVPPYGQPSFPALQPGPQQATSFTAQQTGYISPSIQPQVTGIPAQGFLSQQQFQNPQQQQFNGYSLQNQQPGLASPLQTGQSQNPSLAPQRTAQTSSQIAQSFQPKAPAQPATSRPTWNSAKIPKIRLSFLTAQDQAKFEQLFKSAVGDGQALDGIVNILTIQVHRS